MRFRFRVTADRAMRSTGSSAVGHVGLCCLCGHADQGQAEGTLLAQGVAGRGQHQGAGLHRHPIRLRIQYASSPFSSSSVASTATCISPSASVTGSK